MIAPTEATLIGLWDPGSRLPAQRRLAALLAAVEDPDSIGRDTLGDRNRRLLSLHRVLVGGPLEASVICRHCSAHSEFTVPADAILATLGPGPDACVRIRRGGDTLSFRLPRMADLEDAGLAGGDVRRAVLERCLTEADAAIDDDAIEDIGRQFDALDPAANIVVNIACSGCARPIAASVEPATFVARELDRVVNGIFRDIDLIASAYGWSEQAILELPTERRRRYVAMITAVHAQARPTVIRRRA